MRRMFLGLAVFCKAYCLILFFAMAFEAAPAIAEMLLAEVNWRQPEPITIPASFNYGVYKDGPGTPNIAIGISTSVTSVDEFPKTTIDDHPSSLAVWNATLADGERVIRRARFSSDGQIINPPFGHSPFDAIWFDDPDPNDAFNVKAYVPNLGGETLETGLVGYLISSVKQVVTPAGQTVYFYGTLIPEPNTALLMLFASLKHISVRRRR